MNTSLNYSFLKKYFTINLLFLVGILPISCQKNDKNLSCEDAFIIQEAKSYFENNASALKSFIFETHEGHNHGGHASTKVVKESSSMVLDWDNAHSFKTVSADIVEVPIKMSAPIYGVLYDGFGNAHLNRKQATFKSSLIVENKHAEGMSYYVLTLCGLFNNNGSKDAYCFSTDKTNFSGYEIFSDENGDITKVYGYNKGVQRVTNLNPINKSMIDSSGRDIYYKGLQFLGSLSLTTKAGVLPETGELNMFLRCPKCSHQNSYVSSNCSACGYYLGVYFGEDEYCLMCYRQIDNCLCCPDCLWFPCLCEFYCYTNCSYCGALGCTGQCLGEGCIPDPPTYFEPGSVTISVYPVSSGTTSSVYNYITRSYTLTATANPGYTFAYWGNLENEIVSTSNPFNIFSVTDIHLVAVFTQN